MIRSSSLTSPVRPRLVVSLVCSGVLEVSIAALDFSLCSSSYVSEFSFTQNTLFHKLNKREG